MASRKSRTKNLNRKLHKQKPEKIVEFIVEKPLSERKRHKNGYFFGVSILTLLVVISVFLWSATRWLFKTFPHITMDELLFYSRASIGDANSTMIKDALIQSLTLPLMVLILLPLAFHFIKRKMIPTLLSIVLVVGSLFLVGDAFTSLEAKLQVRDYIQNQNTSSDFIEQNYVNPNKVSISFPEKKRNLIYLYLESMEVTFMDELSGGSFSENVIPELTTLAKENESFAGNSNKVNGGYVLPGGGFTTAAMFSTSAGLPMRFSANGMNVDFFVENVNFNYIQNQDNFFGGVKFLGDILEDEGYHNVLLFGSPASFGGRELYYSTHGHYDIHDYPWAIEQGIIPENYYVWWGFEDEKMFDEAKNELLDLAKEDQPFNLTLLTADTHFEDGYLCDDCPDIYDDQYSNVMACSSKKVYDFIKWVQAQDFYEDTTIILTGDHITMDSDYCDDVSEEYERKTYTAYINSAVEPVNNKEREYSTLDHFPTVLAALGADIDGNKLGLGVNLFSDENTLIEEYGVENLTRELLKQSPFMDNLANLDLSKEGIEDISTSDIEMTNYDQNNNLITVKVDDIEHIDQEVSYVYLEVADENHEDDDAVIVAMDHDGETNIASIDVSEFSKDDLWIRAYAVDVYDDAHYISILNINLNQIIQQEAKEVLQTTLDNIIFKNGQ